MSQEFDPYHRWLGIPPEEQPANHYRLLGLVELESDVEVIRDGAERQIGHVRRYGLGKHSELSQRILNELAAAKACLQDPEKKSQYDAQLRKKPKASKPQPTPQPKVEAPGVSKASELPPPPPRPPLELPVGRADAFSIGKAERAGAPAPGGNLKLVALGGGAAAALLVAVTLTLYLTWRGPGDGKGQTPPSPAAQGARSDPSQLAPRTAEVQAQPRPPKLAKIPDQTAVEGQSLEVKAEVTDRGTASGQLLFGLVQGPQGAMVDAESGVFRWTPAPGQAGVKHLVTLQVAPRDASERAARGTFTISVEEAVLLPPRLEAIPEQEVEAGGKRELLVRASDSSRPPRKLLFTLRESPPWVRIGAQSGSVTLAPPEDDQGGPYRMWVRVSSDVPDAPYVELPLAVVVIARSKPPTDTPSEPAESVDLSGLAEIKGLSGPLNPAPMDVRQTAMAAAQDLMDRAYNDSRVMPLFAGTFGGPVAAVCELNRANRLDGALVSFQPGKDPLSCLKAKRDSILASMARNTPPRVMVPGFIPGTVPGMSPPAQGVAPGGQARRMAGVPADDSGRNVTPDVMDPMGLSTMQIASAQEQALQTFWADVRLWAYFDFQAGSRHGVAALWDADGQRVFWGNYQWGKRHDFCCLFKDDRPRMVVVFDQGQKRSVYLISKNRVQKGFASGDEAQNDATAGPLLNELDGIESLFAQGEQNSEKQIKTTLNFRAGNARQYKNFLAQMRMAARGAAQMQGIQKNQQRAIKGP